MQSIGVAIVGVGYWGEKLLRVFRTTQGMRVHAVYDSSPQRRAVLADQVPCARSLAALLERDEIDAVAIATPPSTHYALAQAVLGAGKHCWVEKPLAMRGAEAHALVEAARRQGRTLFVDETFLYDPLLRHAKSWIEAGRLGRLYHLAFERLGMGRIRRDSDVWWNSAPHDLSILLHLVPAAVQSVHVEAFSYLQPDIADVASATVFLAGGISAHFYLSWLAPMKAARIVVVGSAGMLHYEGRFEQRALRFFAYALADPSTVADNVVPITKFEPVETIPGGPEEPLALAAAAFVDSVRSGRPAPSAGVYSQRVVELLEAGVPPLAPRPVAGPG